MLSKDDLLLVQARLDTKFMLSILLVFKLWGGGVRDSVIPITFSLNYQYTDNIFVQIPIPINFLPKRELLGKMGAGYDPSSVSHSKPPGKDSNLIALSHIPTLD